MPFVSGEDRSVDLLAGRLVRPEALDRAQLAEQAEVSYKRMVQDQQAGTPAKEVGASATPERAALEGQSCAADSQGLGARRTAHSELCCSTVLECGRQDGGIVDLALGV
jgi:hypothetical protein